MILITDPHGRLSSDAIYEPSTRTLDDNISDHLMSKLIGVGMCLAAVTSSAIENELRFSVSLQRRTFVLTVTSDDYAFHSGSSVDSSSRGYHLYWSLGHILVVRLLPLTLGWAGLMRSEYWQVSARR